MQAVLDEAFPSVAGGIDDGTVAGKQARAENTALLARSQVSSSDGTRGYPASFPTPSAAAAPCVVREATMRLKSGKTDRRLRLLRRGRASTDRYERTVDVPDQVEQRFRCDAVVGGVCRHDVSGQLKQGLLG